MYVDNFLALLFDRNNLASQEIGFISLNKAEVLKYWTQLLFYHFYKIYSSSSFTLDLESPLLFRQFVDQSVNNLETTHFLIFCMKLGHFVGA